MEPNVHVLSFAPLLFCEICSSDSLASYREGLCHWVSVSLCFNDLFSLENDGIMLLFTASQALQLQLWTQHGANALCLPHLTDLTSIQLWQFLGSHISFQSVPIYFY